MACRIGTSIRPRTDVQDAGAESKARYVADWQLHTAGKLTKNLGHLSVTFSRPSKSVINIELHHGARKNVATLRTVRTLINNMIIGVTRGYKYKMRYVYAHFPINVNIEKNKETGVYEVEIRYVLGGAGGWGAET